MFLIIISYGPTRKYRTSILTTKHRPGAWRFDGGVYRSHHVVFSVNDRRLARVLLDAVREVMKDWRHEFDFTAPPSDNAWQVEFKPKVKALLTAGTLAALEGRPPKKRRQVPKEVPRSFSTGDGMRYTYPN